MFKIINIPGNSLDLARKLGLINMLAKSLGHYMLSPATSFLQFPFTACPPPDTGEAEEGPGFPYSLSLVRPRYIHTGRIAVSQSPFSERRSWPLSVTCPQLLTFWPPPAACPQSLFINRKPALCEAHKACLCCTLPWFCPHPAPDSGLPTLENSPG